MTSADGRADCTSVTGTWSDAIDLSCMTSPSTKFAITVDMSSVTSGSRRRAKAIDARPSKKSPPRMLSLLPNDDGADGAPRRNGDSSITSS